MFTVARPPPSRRGMYLSVSTAVGIMLVWSLYLANHSARYALPHRTASHCEASFLAVRPPRCKKIASSTSSTLGRLVNHSIVPTVDINERCNKHTSQSQDL